MEISGIAVVITGGGSGIGAEVGRCMAAAGAKVALFDIHQANAEAVAQQIGGMAVHCDVSDEASAVAALRAAKDRHGAARLVVNCAGIANPRRILGRDGPHDLSLFRRLIEVNLVGSFNILRLSAQDMTTLEPMGDGERGLIVNTASIAAFEGQIGQAAYSASKGGIVGLTLPAARELAKFGIRVVTVAPGLVETPIFGSLSSEAVESLVASTVFPKRLGQPREMAALIRHIAENVLINGETIRADGAIRLAPK